MHIGAILECKIPVQQVFTYMCFHRCASKLSNNCVWERLVQFPLKLVSEMHSN